MLNLINFYLETFLRVEYMNSPTCMCQICMEPMNDIAKVYKFTPDQQKGCRQTNDTKTTFPPTFPVSRGRLLHDVMSQVMTTPT